MEITYIGHSCFKIKGKNISLVIDPYDPTMLGYKLPTLSADAVLLTHDHPDHANVQGVKDYRLVISAPGEYEISDVFVYGLQTFHDESEGSKRGNNTIYSIEIDDFSLMHLGDLGHILSAETLEKIGTVDVLMIPVGGVYTIDSAAAVKVISSIEPGIIIPMHYQTADLKMAGDKLDSLDKFLDEMGIEKPRTEGKLKLSSR
ncbi:MBL fold metallo-hydrolase, partial [candidate division WWE3 bacterium]|nr:MBL fold metallo-hydrolase [candidate division WWE3 bacterium]